MALVSYLSFFRGLGGEQSAFPRLENVAQVLRAWKFSESTPEPYGVLVVFGRSPII